jgi:hypothetical protein
MPHLAWVYMSEHACEEARDKAAITMPTTSRSPASAIVYTCPVSSRNQSHIKASPTPSLPTRRHLNETQLWWIIHIIKANLKPTLSAWVCTPALARARVSHRRTVLSQLPDTSSPAVSAAHRGGAWASKHYLHTCVCMCNTMYLLNLFTHHIHIYSCI